MNLDFTNIYPNPTTYSYSGWVFVTTYGEDPGNHEPFSHTEYFDCPNLLEARKAAINWYYDTLNGLIKEGSYFLPFTGPKDFEFGKNAAFSIGVFMVHSWGDQIDEFCLLGYDEDAIEETIEMEKIIFKQLGLVL